MLDVLERHLDFDPTGEREITSRHLVRVLQTEGVIRQSFSYRVKSEPRLW